MLNFQEFFTACSGQWTTERMYHLVLEGQVKRSYTEFRVEPITTYYRRSVAVDQMRLVAPDLRLRTIVTYQRPTAGEPPSVIDLVGFGVERKQSA